MSVVEGELLAGKYRVERVLGQGGMGVVVAAHHVVLDQLVAIKFLLPEALHSAEAVARFEREARAAVKIQSEHVARVMDVGRLENGAPYMVMELLRGHDLEVLLLERGPLPLADVADYVLQAGEAIAEAHGLGIVHRDLKPANLFHTQRADGSSRVKVLDFGISKLIMPGSAEQGMTSTAAIIGSPLYMSPEQLMSARDVDMRSDIWSLGVICFELLTGKLPFQADTLPQLCMAIQLSPPVPVRRYKPDLPPEVEVMLLRCLAKDPSKRYSTIAQFANELVKFAPNHARLSAERIERLARAAGFATSALVLPRSSGGIAAASELHEGNRTIAEFAGTKPDTSSGKWRVGVGLGALLAVGGVAAFVVWRQAPPKPESAPSSTALSASPLPIDSTSRIVPALSESPDTTPVADPIPPITTTGRPPPATSIVKPPSGPPAGARSPVNRTARPAPSATVVSPPSPDCSIPFFYDARGNKVFKKGCL